MKEIRKILLFLLFLIFLMFCPKYTAETALANYGMLAEQGLHIYVIPDGKTGMENGQFWVYAEMMGEKNTPYVNSEWTIEAEVHHLGSDKVYEVEDWVLLPENTGYVVKKFDLIDQYEYKDYKLTVRIKDGETIIEEKKETVANLIVAWPLLQSNEWMETIGYTQEMQAMEQAVGFDWENDALFSRLFTVDVQKKGDVLDIEQKKENVWMIKATDMIEEDVTFHLQDKAGNTEDYVFAVKIIKEEFPKGMKVLISTGIALVLSIIALILQKKLASIEKEEKDDITLPTDAISFTDITDKIESARSNLEKEKKMYDKKVQEYRELLSQELKILKADSEGSEDFLKDYQILTQKEGKQGIADEELEKYQVIKEEIQFYRASDYTKWMNDAEEKIVEYQQFTRDLVDLAKYFHEEKVKCTEKINLLKIHVKQVLENLAVLQAPLGMPISIVIEKDDKIYRINVGLHDQGFVLDDKHPLNQHYYLEEENISTLLGAETGISIASCQGKNYVLLKSKTQNLLRKNQVITEKQIHESNTYEFLYRFEDGSEANICIDTN